MQKKLYFQNSIYYHSLVKFNDRKTVKSSYQNTKYHLKELQMLYLGRFTKSWNKLKVLDILS